MLTLRSLHREGFYGTKKFMSTGLTTRIVFSSTASKSRSAWPDFPSLMKRRPRDSSRKWQIAKKMPVKQRS